MNSYITKVINGLSPDHKTNDKAIIEEQLNILSHQIDGCVDNLGAFVDVVSIEHFETYSALAENVHIKFTVHEDEAYGNYLRPDRSSYQVEDYDYHELTGEKC